MEIERQSSGIGQSAAGKASVKSCFINLANTIVGGGMLGLPYAFSHTGYALGSILMALCAIASGFSLHLLALCSLKQEGPSSFFSLAKEALPKFTAVIDIAVAITCFGAASSFLVIIGDLMPQVMQQFGASSAIQDRQLWVFLGFVVVTPLSCLRNLDSLKFTSVMAMVFVVFLTLLVILYAADIPSLNPCVDVDDGDVCKGSTTDAQVTFKTGQTISVIVFAFGCQQNIFAVVNEIERPTMPRIDAVILLAIVLVFLIYMVVAGCGYKTYGDEVEPDILVSYPTNIVTSIARLAVSLLVAFSYPLQAHPARMCVLTLLSEWLDSSENASLLDHAHSSSSSSSSSAPYDVSGNVNSTYLGDSAPVEFGAPVSTVTSNGTPASSSKSNTSTSSSAHEGSMMEPRFAITTIVFLVLSLVVGLTVTNLSTVQGLSGATGSNAISFILPGFFYFNMFSDEEGPVWKRYAALTLGVIGLIMVPLFVIFMFL